MNINHHHHYPGKSCCEKLLKAGEAKVYLSLDGVKLDDLSQVLRCLLGSRETMGSEALHVASMMAIKIRRHSETIDHLVSDLLDDAIVPNLDEEVSVEDERFTDDLEEEMGYIFTGNDCLLDEISLSPLKEFNVPESTKTPEISEGQAEDPCLVPVACDSMQTKNKETSEEPIPPTSDKINEKEGEEPLELHNELGDGTAVNEPETLTEEVEQHTFICQIDVNC